MRGDDLEARKLIASAESKNFSIRAYDEAEICEAWVSGHICILLLHSHQLINELMCRSTGAMILADDEKDKSDEKMAAKVYGLQMNYREQRKASLLAFRDWMAQHDFQIETEMLEANNVDFSLIEFADERELRETQNYKMFARIFQEEVWDQTISSSGNS